MVGKEHPHSRENRILNIRAVSAPPEHSNQRRMNMIAKTILEQIGGRRFAAMTGSKDFIDMGNGLRMSLARNKTSANRLDIIYDAGADLYNMRFYRRTFSKTQEYISFHLQSNIYHAFYPSFSTVSTDWPYYIV